MTYPPRYCFAPSIEPVVEPVEPVVEIVNTVSDTDNSVDVEITMSFDIEIETSENHLSPAENEIEKDVKACLNDLLDDVEKKSIEPSKRLNVRKRKTDQSQWVVTKRQKAVESGKEHINNKGKTIPAKKIVLKKDCAAKCKFDCCSKIDKETQESIFLQFYKLDREQKHAFIAQTTVCSSTAAEKTSRKNFNYTYFLLKGESSFRVCKKFYLSTLAISQKMVYGVHEKKDKISGALRKDGRGKHGKHLKVTEEQKADVMQHIKSFPAMESHYCRAKTNKKYLQSDLNIEKMYDLYKSKCFELKKDPVKSSFYRYIFNTCFNIGFHVPKTDRCEKCEEIKIKKKENMMISPEEKESHNKHIAEKLAMREEIKKKSEKKNMS